MTEPPCCTTLWTDVLTALGTVGAVVVALFGYLLPRFFPPRLRVAISNPHGVRQRVRVMMPAAPAPVARDGWARYYQLEVSNARRRAKAHNVRVVLLKLETETAVGWVDTWGGGGIPLKWQHQEALAGARTLGPPIFADLFNVMRLDGEPPLTQLGLTPIFQPLGVEVNYAGACGLRATIQAQSDETDSDRFVITLRWDGQWVEGAMEMAQHVRWSMDRA